MSAIQPATPDLSRGRTAVVAAAALAAAVAFIANLTTGGWEFILLGLPYLVLCAAHVFIHWRRAGKVGSWPVWTFATFVLSDLVLLGSSLLLAHQGDSSRGWLTITAVVSGGPGRNLSDPPIWSAVFWLTALIAPLGWLALFAATKTSRRAVAVVCIGLLAAASAGLFIGVVAFASSELSAQSAVRETESTRLASLGGTPPAGCGRAPVPVHPVVAGTIWEYDRYVGQAPVWLNLQGLAIEKGRAVEHMGDIPQLERGAGGFTLHLEWVTNADFADSIHIRMTDAASGSELRSEPGAYVYMHDPDLLVPSESSAISVGPTPPYRIFVTTATFPTSPGCYVASASWPGDSWSVTIAVGK